MRTLKNRYQSPETLIFKLTVSRKIPSPAPTTTVQKSLFFLMGKNVTFPHTQDCLNHLTVNQALAWYPWVQTKCKDILAELLDGRHPSQFTCLVRLFAGLNLTVSAEGVSPRASIPSVSFQSDIGRRERGQSWAWWPCTQGREPRVWTTWSTPAW
jgi:hypothetical protein